MSERRRPIQSTLFAGGSPANRTRLSGAVAAPTTRATCGPRLSDLFATLGPGGLWQKTWLGSSQLMLDGSLDPWLESWPRAGMTRSGIAFQRVPLAPLSNGIESGLWPTPGANDWKGSSRPGQRRRQLDEAIEALPAWIPCACCEDYLCTIHLSHAFACPCPSIEEWLSDPYTDRVRGKLAPRFTEWLMGFPDGWTDCGRWATPSCRKSRNGSRGKSSKPWPRR